MKKEKGKPLFPFAAKAVLRQKEVVRRSGDKKIMKSGFLLSCFPSSTGLQMGGNVVSWVMKNNKEKCQRKRVGCDSGLKMVW